MTSDDRDELMVELLSKIVLRLDGMENDLGKAAKAARTKGLSQDTLDAVARRMGKTIDPVLEGSVMQAMRETMRRSDAHTLSAIDTELSHLRHAASLFSDRRDRWGILDWSILGLTSLASLLGGVALVALLLVSSEGAEFKNRLTVLPDFASFLCRNAGGTVANHGEAGLVCWFDMPD